MVLCLHTPTNQGPTRSLHKAHPLPGTVSQSLVDVIVPSWGPQSPGTPTRQPKQRPSRERWDSNLNLRTTHPLLFNDYSKPQPWPLRIRLTPPGPQPRPSTEPRPSLPTPPRRQGQPPSTPNRERRSIPRAPSYAGSRLARGLTPRSAGRASPAAGPLLRGIPGPMKRRVDGEAAGSRGRADGGGCIAAPHSPARLLRRPPLERKWRRQGAEVTAAHPEVMAGGGRVPPGQRRFADCRRRTLPRS